MLKWPSPRILVESGRRLIAWCRNHWFWTLVILVFAFAGEQVVTLPYGSISSLAKKNPTHTAFMEQQAEQAKREGRRFSVLQKWIPLKDIPRDVINAVVVAEDGTFWSNQGFDWYELKESIGRDFAEGRWARGASTITQQLVKNLYLSPSKNPVRKIKEWILTWWMNRELSKTRILELYLNVIEWGNGVYGIEGASWYYFGKPAGQLSRIEAARLAAIIPDPEDLSADSDEEYVLRRTDIVLQRMEARGY